MKFVLNIGKIENLDVVMRIPVIEVVVQTSSFSLCGRISDDELLDVVKSLDSHGKKITLQWDSLCHDKEIERLINLFSDYSSLIQSVRFADPGVGAYLKNRFPNLQLQFFMWDGHQNRAGILNWIQVFQPSLQRVIISNQMSRESIQKLGEETNVPIEIRVLGRLQLFYSARKLLDKQTEIRAVSTDRPSQFLSVEETSQGTSIYNDKDLFLLDKLDEIQKIGVDFLGVELNTTRQYQMFEDSFEKPGWVDTLKKSWNTPLTSGFFEQNKTDSLLTRLTNTYLKNEKQNQIGSVLESIKSVHTLLHLHQNLTIPRQVVFLTPERKSIRFELNKLQDLKGNMHQGEVSEGFYLLPWIKYVVPASILKTVSAEPEGKIIAQS